MMHGRLRHLFSVSDPFRQVPVGASWRRNAHSLAGVGPEGLLGRNEEQGVREPG